MRNDLEVFSEALTSLLPTVGSDSFPAQLVVMLKRLVPFNNALVLVYTKNQPPKLAYNDLPTAERQVNIERFLAGAYLLDPCYRAIMDNKDSGFFRLKNITPNGFTSSEYYRRYYRFTGLVDEFGYLLKVNGDSSLNISLERTGMAQVLNRREIQVLTNIAPVITELCRQHWGKEMLQREPSTLHYQLESALDNFGLSVLTDRERQVVQMFLHGHSTKSIANRLGISPETVKLHRKNSYAKLDVSSQAELFYLFIDSLVSLDNYTGGDPLVGYLTHTQ